MWRNEHAPGNMAALVMAPMPGLKTFSETIAAAREGASVSEAA